MTIQFKGRKAVKVIATKVEGTRIFYLIKHRRSEIWVSPGMQSQIRHTKNSVKSLVSIASDQSYQRALASLNIAKQIAPIQETLVNHFQIAYKSSLLMEAGLLNHISVPQLSYSRTI